MYRLAKPLLKGLPAKVSARYVDHKQDIFPIANFKKALELNFATRYETSLISLEILSVANCSDTDVLLTFSSHISK